MAIRKLLDCPDVDFVAGPSHYGNRRIGSGYSSFMSLVDSVKLHNKLWYNENDFMSPLGSRGAEDSHAETVDDYIEVQKFCYASVVCGGVSQWLLSFNEGWYDDPKLMSLIARQVEIDREALSWDRASTAEVAIIVDDTSQLHQPVANIIPDFDRESVSRFLIYDLPPRVGRCGTAVDRLLLDDLDTARPYKVYIVLNAFALDAHKRELLKWRLHRGGAIVLWMYAPGFLDHGWTVEGIRDLTGMRVRNTRDSTPTSVTMTSGGHPLLERSMAGVYELGNAQEIAPRFWIDDPNALILGHASQGRKPVLGIRAFKDWTSVYLASPITLDDRFIRELARMGGAHIYYEGPDATYIGPGLIGIHAQEPGRKTINLPYPANVRELYTQRDISKGAKSFSVEVKLYETMLFRFERS
jgi:hypothetical protein